ncbi:hypothetical protein ALC60_05209 [Trachymyrmex zeteki]|uniref:Uncharacterized protein n=1 Tax=Mycetomoellerius zeteki TaxID=64791 RepID=A0A151X6D9_9HYME|nr:hypothetical protein ALC60_05209 [Trachymyrmex zeteki]
MRKAYELRKIRREDRDAQNVLCNVLKHECDFSMDSFRMFVRVDILNAQSDTHSEAVLFRCGRAGHRRKFGPPDT